MTVAVARPSCRCSRACSPPTPSSACASRAASTSGLAIYLAYLVPPSILFIPLATMVFKLGLYDSPMALILTYPTFLIPFCTWLLIGYFKSIPYELEECALIDGATRLQILWKITLPLAVPGLISAGIFAFTLSWNEFIYALAFIQSVENKTVPVAVLTQLVEGDVYHWGSLMAGALLGSIPVAIFYSFFVEHYVTDICRGVAVDVVVEQEIAARHRLVDLASGEGATRVELERIEAAARDGVDRRDVDPVAGGEVGDLVRLGRRCRIWQARKDEFIFASATAHLVEAQPTEKIVVSVAAEQLVVAGKPLKVVAAAEAAQRVGPGCCRSPSGRSRRSGRSASCRRSN